MGLNYKGGGSLAGIPARDLSDDEVKRFGKKRLLESGLYYEPKRKTKSKPKKPEDLVLDKPGPEANKKADGPAEVKESEVKDG